MKRRVSRGGWKKVPLLPAAPLASAIEAVLSAPVAPAAQLVRECQAPGCR